MRLRNRHIKNIIEANNDNRLAIFVGAGISKNSDTKSQKLPTWNDLITELKKDLELENETDFLKIAQLYYLEFKEHSYFKKLKAYFPENIKPSTIHQQIFELNPQIIITTNWDCILEKAIEENAYIYDIIRCDEDLVKSTLQKKLIKMHGDFKNHNIVFKEDDYLNYHYNFPLIENYIKSILSTHTILFLGYSYNDINFKLIMKWLQNNSKVQPPRYLTVFKENPTQTKYLENYGINTFILDDPHKTMQLNKDYFGITEKFLHMLKSNEDSELLKTDNDIIEYIYNKLKILSGLNYILLEQIQNSLTNCGFIYDDDITILEFYNDILTIDIDNNKRNIYKKFKLILAKYDKDKIRNDKIKQIFEILHKANVQGIIISENKLQTSGKEYIVISEYIADSASNSISSIFYNFQFNTQLKSTNDIADLLDSAYHHYQLQIYDKSYEIIEKTISICLKQKNYISLFIAMFNKNVLIRILKFGFVYDTKKYNSAREYNLEDKFNELPKDIQIALKPIYSFLNSCYLYKYAFQTTEYLRKKEESKKIIESGGFVFNSNITESVVKHNNIISFVIRNRIMMESYIEFKYINKHFIKIALIRQIQKEKISLKKLELYSSIKYLNTRELKQLLEEYYKSDSKSKGKFYISDVNKTWLIDSVFNNIINIYMNSRIMYYNYENYLENLIFLLSLTQLTEEENKKVMEYFQKIIDKTKNTIGIYQSINLFLGVQYNLYESDIDASSLLNLIKTIISKFINKQYNGYDFHVLTNNEIFNLYGYAKQKNAIFDDEHLTNKLLTEINNLPVNEQIDISKSLLLSIYDIGTDKLKKQIKSFMLNINLDDSIEQGNCLTLKLLLIIKGFKSIDDGIVDELNEYIKKFDKSNNFSTILYTFNNEIDFLMREKDYDQLQPISKKIKAAIENYEKNTRLSIF